MLVRLRPLVVYVTGIHVARAVSRIFVASALSQVHSEEIPVFSFEAESCIRGYRIYKAVWTPYIGEPMPCSRELTNGHSRLKSRSCTVKTRGLLDIYEEILPLYAVFA